MNDSDDDEEGRIVNEERTYKPRIVAKKVAHEDNTETHGVVRNKNTSTINEYFSSVQLAEALYSGTPSDESQDSQDYEQDRYGRTKTPVSSPTQSDSIFSHSTKKTKFNTQQTKHQKKTTFTSQSSPRKPKRPGQVRTDTPDQDTPDQDTPDQDTEPVIKREQTNVPKSEHENEIPNLSPEVVRELNELNRGEPAQTTRFPVMPHMSHVTIDVPRHRLVDEPADEPFATGTVTRHTPAPVPRSTTTRVDQDTLVIADNIENNIRNNIEIVGGEEAITSDDILRGVISVDQNALDPTAPKVKLTVREFLITREGDRRLHIFKWARALTYTAKLQTRDTIKWEEIAQNIVLKQSYSLSSISYELEAVVVSGFAHVLRKIPHMQNVPTYEYLILAREEVSDLFMQICKLNSQADIVTSGARHMLDKQSDRVQMKLDYAVKALMLYQFDRHTRDFFMTQQSGSSKRRHGEVYGDVPEYYGSVPLSYKYTPPYTASFAASRRSFV